MLKKIIITICLNIMLVVSAIAQYGNFSIKVRKVFPTKGVVYENTYNLLDELDKAKLAAIKKYKGTSENYLIEMTTPNGVKTEAIQNIKWIMSEDGEKSYFKSEPNLPPKYPYETTVLVYECNNDGSQKNKPKSRNYKYSYKLFINKKEQHGFDKNYYTKDDGDIQAAKALKQMANDDSLYEIVRVNDNVIVATNVTAYNKQVCGLMLERFKGVQTSHDTVLIKFYYEVTVNSTCNDIKTKVANEIETRYTKKLFMADTATYANKIILYEEAKVLKPQEAENLNKYIAQARAKLNEQEVVKTEKPGWFKRTFGGIFKKKK